MPLDLPEPIESIVKGSLAAGDATLDGVLFVLDKLSDALSALEARVEELESQIT